MPWQLRRKAFPVWSHMPWQERVALLRKAADLIDERIFEMGAAMALEVGKNRMEVAGRCGRNRRPDPLFLLPDGKE